MATAKPASKAVAAEENTGGKKSKKTLIIILAAVLLVVLAGGGGAAWFLLKGKGDHGAESAHGKAAPDPSKPPVFLPMDAFTVNLQQDGFGDQYLQTQFTLQVTDPTEVDLIKTYMPLVRSRLLMLLSGKKASDISTPEGKNKLSGEIIETVNKPFNPRGTAQNVTGVFFTSFVIQ